MSSLAPAGLDRTALPEALLPIAKAHLRVDGIYDDAYISSAIARAISWFERVTNVSVNPVTWTWTPALADFVITDGLGHATVPVSPVTDVAITDATDAVLTDNFTVETMSTHGVGIYSLVGMFVAGMSVEIDSGYEDATELDPGILDAVLRYTAHLYEHREILVLGTDAQTPGWMTDVISTYWMPRA